MKPVLFLDLDGPLIDVRPRYFALHARLVRQRGGSPLPAAEYWARKRDRESEVSLLTRSGLAPEAAEAECQARLALVESAEWLRHDVAWPWTLDVLPELAVLARLVLVTQRIAGAVLEQELTRHGLRGAFSEVLAGRGDDTPTAKVERIRQSAWRDEPALGWVGDTEVDVASARALGIPSIWTRTGIRSDRAIDPFRPDGRVDDLRGLSEWLAGRSRA